MRRLLVAVLAVPALLAAVPAGAVVGGVEAEAGEWPWQVVLLVDDRVWCGGSLVAADVVLTAAHCAGGADVDEMEVVAGVVDLDDPGGQRRRVAAADRHEGFDVDDLENDIALLHLDAPFELGDRVGVVRLADAATSARLAVPGAPATVTGFGAVVEDGDLAGVLLEGDVPIVADDRCAALYAQDGDEVVARSQLCAGRDRGQVDACFGDSGGPLVVRADDGDGGWVQVGIVSWGAGCGRRLRPTVYTEVAAYASWLAGRGVGPGAGETYVGGSARIPAQGTVGKAGRYPLRLRVKGAPEELRFVAVRLIGLSHTDPEDLDIWLVAPDGTVVTLLSDVGGAEAVEDATVLIVDSARPAGTDRLGPEVAPTDREPDPQRRGVAPRADLAALEGIDPNGEWQLLVADDHRGGHGRLEAWSLQLG